MNITWIDSEREPKCEPDPAFPNGKDLDVSSGSARTCVADLPCPAKRCGLYTVECPTCGLKIFVTTAGRPDDPKSVRVACKVVAQ